MPELPVAAQQGPNANLSLPRLVGFALLIGGVVLVRR